MLKLKHTTKTLFLLFFGVHTFVMAQISPKEAISQMKHGINLGNTLEPPLEGDWGNPPTQEYFFDMYKKEGFDYVRVPVRWDKHMSTTSPFKIDEAWMKRVEQILDWGLARGIYMVVNSHHDNWIKEAYSNPVNQARFDSLWSQVAVRFRNKSDKLIFEIANEPVSPMTKAQNDEMHKNAIKVIRKTNPTRLIIFQGIDWGGSDALIDAAIPDDKNIIGSFHSYDPYPFGLEGTGTFGPVDIINLRAKFQKVKDWSNKNNIPVFLGEFGSTSKCDYNSRMKQYKTYMELSETFGFAPTAWDDGGDFRIMERAAKGWNVDLKDILTHSSLNSPQTPRIAIFQDTIVKLDWTNPASNYDSIYIERKTSATATYKKIAALKGNTITYNDIKLPQNKEYFYRVIAHFNAGNDLYSYPQKIFLPTYVPKEPVKRQLYTGKAIEIPGRLEAEYFDIGEDGLTYHDSDTKNLTGALRPTEPIDIYDLGGGKYFVIDNYPGEWLEYTVNVAQKGTYEISASIAAFAGGGTFSVTIGGVESEVIKAPASISWINTKTVTFSMNLEAGQQIMRISFIDKPLFYLDYLDFKRLIPTKISPELDLASFNVYQNQQGLVFNLGTNNSAKVLKIYTIMGSLVKTIINPEANFSLPAQEFHSGVYIVQLDSGDQKISKKIIIQ